MSMRAGDANADGILNLRWRFGHGRRRDGARAEQFENIASKLLHDRYIHTNPSAFGLDDVMIIREHVA
ncbi:MAG: hypothetical protein ACI8PT_001393 [Gammaproteobacteria bacterium]|jgi:hypothetical protein